MKSYFFKLYESDMDNADLLSQDTLIKDTINVGTGKILDLNATNGYMPLPYLDYDLVLLDGKEYRPQETMKYVQDATAWMEKRTGSAIMRFFNRLEIVFSFHDCPTMWTDGRYICMNPKFVEELVEHGGGTVVLVAFVILHEIFHNVCDHVYDGQKFRGKFPDHELQNIAMDYEVNWILEHSLKEFNPDTNTIENVLQGVTKLAGGMYDDKYADTLWTTIYPKLSDKDKPLPPEPPIQPPVQDQEIIFTDDGKAEYERGFNEVIEEARKQGLIS
jgi:hypothetical protein